MIDKDLIVEVNKQYKWLVKRGNLTFWISDDKLMVAIDQEGEESCYLTVQDALDIYSILQQFGQYLFKKSNSSINYETKFIQESKNSFIWYMGKEKLKIFLDKNSNYLQVEYSNNQPISLDINLISEIAQAIGIIIKNNVL